WQPTSPCGRRRPTTSRPWRRSTVARPARATPPSTWSPARTTRGCRTSGAARPATWRWWPSTTRTAWCSATPPPRRTVRSRRTRARGSRPSTSTPPLRAAASAGRCTPSSWRGCEPPGCTSWWPSSPCPTRRAPPCTPLSDSPRPARCGRWATSTTGGSTWSCGSSGS
ncbi:MAG: hypothetical protein AVDCRST_MAG06-1544, partial [uncultured Nocardioides sp.]